MAEIHEQKGKKRKKKRSCIQMAKKFAHRKNHGTDLDSETYQYMVRILELMRDGFPNVEEKLIFVNNVYEQSVGHEVEYARNQIGSRVLESLLKYASLEAIQRLVGAFRDFLRPMSNDRFASHVLEKIIVICANRGNSSENVQGKAKVTEDTADVSIDVSESDAKLYNDITLMLCKYFINNLEEFVWDTYANHLLRTVVECLGGLINLSEGQSKMKQSSYNIERREVIQEYKDLLIQACSRLYKWPQFHEFGKDELTSGFLQSVLFSLKDIDEQLTTKFVEKIQSECLNSGGSETISDIFDSESSVRLLEACLAVANPELFTCIYKKYFVGNLRSICSRYNKNITVQRLLDHCNTKETLEPIFEEIEKFFPDMLNTGYTGVLVSLANACKKLQTKQGAYVNAMIKILECDSEEDQSQIVKSISCLKKKEEIEIIEKESNKTLPVDLRGSLILQAILNFNKPIKIVNSLLAMNIDQLLYLISDPKGSRIIDAFMDSKYIGEKSREKLGRKLKGCWAQLAQSTHGSRCLDKIWTWAQQKQRLLIMEELAVAGESLRGTKSGKIIYNKLNVPLFARSKKDWTETRGKEEKVKNLFADIIKRPEK